MTKQKQTATEVQAAHDSKVQCRIVDLDAELASVCSASTTELACDTVRSRGFDCYHVAQARSHKGEIILVPFTEPELALALNMVLNLRKLSFDHFLLLGFDEACCLHAAAVISDVGARCSLLTRLLPAACGSGPPDRARLRENKPCCLPAGIAQLWPQKRQGDVVC